MKILSYTSATLILVSAAFAAFSQNSGSIKTDKKTQQEELPRTDGLKKISSGSARDWDFDVHIDHVSLEKNIEVAIENAMKSVEALERLEINIDPIEINLKDLNMDINPIVINIPNPVVAIDPIEINIPDIDVNVDADIDHDHSNWRDDDNDEDNDIDVEKDHHRSFDKEDSNSHWNKHKEKEKMKNESGKEEKEKAKGLKKLN
ncbi:MAG TPA: hypothetical protein VGQ59_18765 [Cyclobacteriaceae bacterium]|jgi:hypothetical protein|nr:hypothetical protein [Cyclobacteriaceae bacterium]